MIEIYTFVTVFTTDSQRNDSVKLTGIHTVEVIFERTQWHVLVNQDSMAAVGAETDKADEIGVAQRVEHPHASKELAVALVR